MFEFFHQKNQKKFFFIVCDKILSINLYLASFQKHVVSLDGQNVNRHIMYDLKTSERKL